MWDIKQVNLENIGMLDMQIGGYWAVGYYSVLLFWDTWSYMGYEKIVLSSEQLF